MCIYQTMKVFSIDMEMTSFPILRERHIIQKCKTEFFKLLQHMV